MATEDYIAVERMTQNTLTDLRSMEQSAEDSKDRYFLGLCTLFLATIEDAKDRITQLELVFCNQLFPAFQARLFEFQPARDAQDWPTEKESLVSELNKLRSERNELLRAQEAECDKLLTENGELDGKNCEVKDGEDEHGCDLSTGMKVQKQSERSHALKPAPGTRESEDKLLHGKCLKLEQKNAELHKQCLKLSSEVQTLKSMSDNDMNSQCKAYEETQETNFDDAHRLSEELEKERKANRENLLKLQAIKQSYRSLKKQYTVLFRQSNASGQNKHVSSVSGCKKQNLADFDENVHSRLKEDNKKCNCKKSGKCSYSTSLPTESHCDRKISKKCPSEETFFVSVAKTSIQDKHIASNEKLSSSTCGGSIGDGCNAGTVCADKATSGKNRFTENYKDDDDMTLETNMKSNGFLHESGNHDVVRLDQESQGDFSGSIWKNLAQMNEINKILSTSNDEMEKISLGGKVQQKNDSLPDCADSRAHDNEMAAVVAFAPLRKCPSEQSKAIGDKRSAANDWATVQKRSLDNTCQPIAIKSLKTTWRNTRSRAERDGFDPHDDFLDTPHEDVIRNIQVKNNNNGAKHTKSSKHGKKDISFSQDSTQDPNEGSDHDEFMEKKHNEETFIRSSRDKLSLPKSNREQESKSKTFLAMDKTNKESSSFMMPPKAIPASKQGPGFKYVEPVRKKDERENLQGVECNQCKRFYDAVLEDNGDPGSAAGRCEHHNAVSRHRYRYAPPATPEGFWNIGFDSDL